MSEELAVNFGLLKVDFAEFLFGLCARVNSGLELLQLAHALFTFGVGGGSHANGARLTGGGRRGHWLGDADALG